jgi:diaminopimelate epimerase
MTIPVGRRFYKMSGSGNDFVFFDARSEGANGLDEKAVVEAICARRTGVGADGIVLIEPAAGHAFGIRYFNSDGSLASLCGNASLCSVRLATDLGAAPAEGDFTFLTGDGPVRGRMADGNPQIDLQPVRELVPSFDVPLEPGEQRIGFARVGVPHLTILCDDIEIVNVAERGRELRNHQRLADGANANFVASTPRGWAMRTYERGVEAETLACGTGAVSCAALLRSWGRSGDTTTIWTRSGLPLIVSLRDDGGRLRASLSGEGRIVFSGELAATP